MVRRLGKMRFCVVFVVVVLSGWEIGIQIALQVGNRQGFFGPIRIAGGG